ncbi:MAG TPA: DegT/DnrJ/EryC1/StrS family aminotransferase, partial [Planctomycetota bacterium]|nr:DegT/DnrJ/EryC1/StrS family aminotransferase [Planctomycetota bacterium]
MSSRIPLVDLLASHRSLGSELPEAIARVLDSGRYIQGTETRRFEEAFARYCGTKEAIAVDSGTAALHLAFLACGLKPGDEVLTSPFTFVATGTALLHANLTPVFADIRPGDFNLDPGKIDAGLTSKTRAILPVHLFGTPCDMTAIADIAKRRRLLVIEDAAQAHGAVHAGRRVGSFGEAATFSFYPSKNLAAVGDGGAVVTSKADVAQDVRLRRDHGRTSKYEHGLLGWNYRMDEFQAAALNVKLPRLDGWNDRRRALAARYQERLKGLPLTLPTADPGSVWHLYVIRTPKRDALREHLDREGIETGVHYPLPLHLQPPFASLGHKRGRFPESERAAAEVLSLPIYPELGEEGVNRVASAIRKFFGA